MSTRYYSTKSALICAICAGVADGLALSPSSALRVVGDTNISRSTFHKLKNQRSGYYLVGGRHAASCAVFTNSHEVGQCPLDDASDDGFWWSIDADGRITNKKNGFSLYAQSGAESLQLLANVAGNDNFKWSVLSDKRIENLKVNTFLCAGAWGEHPGDTRVRNLQWADENKQLNTDHVPVGYTGFEWNLETEASFICDQSGLVGNWERTTFSEQSQPGTQMTVPLGPGSVAHTISARVVWPSSAAYPSKRAWIMNVGQHAKGAHHWLWNPSSSVKSQIGVWRGVQSQTELPANPPPSILLTTTSDGTTLKVYVDGQLHDTASSAAFDFHGAIQNVDVAKDIYSGDVGFPGGSVEGLCIWNRVLTAQEVAQMSPSPVDQCIASCKSKGYCCNDPSVGSVNQYLSCAQACTIRSLGTPVAECNNICDESRKCHWTVNQNTYGACSSCSDQTSSCPHGVQDTTACHDGCSFGM